MDLYAEYNPLDYDNLTENLVRELLSRSPQELPLPQFAGSGIYALFYHGSFEPYQRFSQKHRALPIYAGKAVPSGSRKGIKKQGLGHELFKRLTEHTRSIHAAQNLELSDFSVRFLVVTPLWITMAERFLIEHFQPLWNVCLEGFGNHDPGKGRHAGDISWWDTVHPGRAWAKKLKQSKTQTDAIDRLKAFAENQR